MKVVILCGGKGTRLREETEYRPKPMVPIGGMPMLWHIMKIYAAHGHTDFILCLGYKGEMIKDFFRNYLWATSDVTLELGRQNTVTFHDRVAELDWKVTLADTGEESMTSYRVKRIEKYLGNDVNFLLTYGDGVGDIDITASIDFHRQHGRACTLTGVHPPGRFGELGIGTDATVTHFNEKPQAEGSYINGGYMVCDRRLLSYLPNDPGMMLERAPMEAMVKAGDLAVFKHDGFWQPMDTYPEYMLLNTMWAKGAAPWKVWS
jgi:glucose-1-phosphate cytidylyltransferase